MIMDGKFLWNQRFVKSKNCFKKTILKCALGLTNLKFPNKSKSPISHSIIRCITTFVNFDMRPL